MKMESRNELHCKNRKIEVLKYIIESHLLRQVATALGPIILSSVFGMITGYTAILMPELLQEDSTIKVDTQLSSWIVSIAAIPIGPGCIFGGYLIEKIGRKATNIWPCVTLILGWFLIATAPNALFILAGRFLAGLSDGIISLGSVVYIAEIAHPKIRGVLIMAVCMGLTFGVLFVHLLGTFLTWRSTAWICGAIPIPFVFLMCVMPESPVFLAKMEKLDEAMEVFYYFRENSEEDRIEYEELIKRQKDLNNTPKESLSQKVRILALPEFWKPAIITTVLFFTTQITGIHVLAAYSIEIIRACGMTDQSISEYAIMIIMDLFKLFASIIACILVEKMPRKSLANLGGYGVTLASFLLCCYLYVASKFQEKSTLLLLLLLVTYVSFISLGLMPLTWILIGEMFPLAYRGLGTSIACFIGFIYFYLIMHTFPYLFNFFGDILGVFAVYGVCTLLGTIFLTFFLPETKDKPLHAIEDQLKQGTEERVVVE